MTGNTLFPAYTWTLVLSVWDQLERRQKGESSEKKMEGKLKKINHCISVSGNRYRIIYMKVFSK